MRLTQGTSRTVKAASLGRCAPPVGPAEDTAAQPAERPPTHPQIHTHTRHPLWSAETPPSAPPHPAPPHTQGRHSGQPGLQRHHKNTDTHTPGTHLGLQTPPHTHSGLCWGEPSGRWEVP